MIGGLAMDNRETEKKELLAYQGFWLRVEEALRKLASELKAIKEEKENAF
jgi:hypothetical protein